MENLKDILLVKETFIYFRKLVCFNLKESVFSISSESFYRKGIYVEEWQRAIRVGEKNPR